MYGCARRMPGMRNRMRRHQGTTQLLAYVSDAMPVEVSAETLVGLLEAMITQPPNKSPEPTPTSGTSAAEQPLVPAAVVAHL